MRRLSAALMSCTLALGFGVGFGCAAGDDPTPGEYLGVEQSDLAAAALPADLAAAAAVPLTDDDLAAPGAVRFAADPATDPGLRADGVVDGELALHPVDHPGQEAIVAVRWGYFPPQVDGEVVDWSGFVAVSRGQIEVLRTLRFEHDGMAPRRPGEDFVRPDADPRLVRFRSHTRPAWDGLLLRVRRPTAHTPTVLVVHVGAETRVLPFEELRALDAAEAVDDAGHELRIRARAEREGGRACAVEVAEAGGEWQATATGGEFRGLIDPEGERLRFGGRTMDVRGPYGLFRGRVKNDDGEIIGRLRGYYAQFHYSPGGALVGRLRSHDGGVRGALVGRYQDGRFGARLLQRDPSCE